MDWKPIDGYRFEGLADAYPATLTRMDRQGGQTVWILQTWRPGRNGPRRGRHKVIRAEMESAALIIAAEHVRRLHGKGTKHRKRMKVE